MFSEGKRAFLGIVGSLKDVIYFSKLFLLHKEIFFYLQYFDHFTIEGFDRLVTKLTLDPTTFTFTRKEVFVMLNLFFNAQ